MKSNCGDDSETCAPKRNAAVAALRIQKVRFSIIHKNGPPYREGLVARDHTNEMSRRFLFDTNVPAGVTEHVAFPVPANAGDASRAKLLVADQRFAGPLAIGAEGEESTDTLMLVMGWPGLLVVSITRLVSVKMFVLWLVSS